MFLLEVIPLSTVMYLEAGVVRMSVSSPNGYVRCGSGMATTADEGPCEGTLAGPPNGPISTTRQ